MSNPFCIHTVPGSHSPCGRGLIRICSDFVRFPPGSRQVDWLWYPVSYPQQYWAIKSSKKVSFRVQIFSFVYSAATSIYCNKTPQSIVHPEEKALSPSLINLFGCFEAFSFPILPDEYRRQNSILIEHVDSSAFDRFCFVRHGRLWTLWNRKEERRIAKYSYAFVVQECVDVAARFGIGDVVHTAVYLPGGAAGIKDGCN